MPIYSIKGPDGKTYSLEGPAGATREQVIQEVKKQQYNQLISGSNKQREGTAGFFEGIVGGAKNILSGSQTAVEAPFISGEEAALRGIERQKGRTERPGFSLDEITKTYEQDGLLSAAGETLSQIPGAIGEQLPFLASMKAGFAAGSALPLPPQAKLLAGVAGSLLTPFLVSSGSAMERKASEQLKKGDKVDINELGAYGTGLASAGLERAALGLSGLSKVMGIDFLKGAGTETAEQIARRSLAATLAKGGGKLVAAEVPTEMGQQALERYYAGLSLTDEEAMREYAEAGAGAAMLAPLGMAGSAYQRRQVRKTIEKREEDIQKRNEEIKRKQEAELKRKEEEKEITETAAKLERQRIEQEAQERKDAIEAELQRARETGEPVKSIQQIINEMTGVAQVKKPLTGKKLTARQKQFQEALDEPSGQFVVGADGIERERTEAEAQGIPVQEYDPTKQKLTKEFLTSKKGLGLGGTAVAVKNLPGLDPTSIEDNEIIRLTLNENLKTRRKGLDDAPSLEAQQKRQEVITKIETYLTALPTTQELENAEYQKALDAEAARRGNEMDDESAAADAALLSIDEAGRTDGPTITSDELARRAGPEPDSLVDPETGEVVDLTGALPKEEFDRQQLEAANKEIQRKEKEIKTKENKARTGKNKTLRAFLYETKLPRSDMDNIMGETSGKSGYMSVFDGKKKLTPSPSLMSLIEGGRVDKFLPPNLRLEADRAVDTAFDAGAAYDYLAERMRNGQEVIEFDLANDIEQEQLVLNNIEESVAKATGAIVDINGVPIPETLIGAYKSKNSDPDNYFSEVRKFQDVRPTSQNDIESLINEYIKGQTQDLRYVVLGKIKGTNEETVWQEQIGSKQKAEEVAKTLEQQGKATDTRVQEYDLNLGPMGIPQESTTQPATTPTQEQSREEYLREVNFYMNNRIDGGIYAPYAEPMNKMYERLGMPQTERSLKNAAGVAGREQSTATPTQEPQTEGVVPMINGIEIPQSLIDTYQDLDRARRNRFMEEDNPQYDQLLKEVQKQSDKFDKELEKIFGKDLEGLNFSEMLIERGVSVEMYDNKKFRQKAVEDAIDNVLKGEPIGTKAEDYYFADNNYIAPVKYKIDPIQKETEVQVGDSTFYKKVDDIQESRTETEQDRLAFELREAEYQAGSYIKASERVPKQLRDRIKKLKEQLAVQESRSDTLGPVETADSITESLRKEFGSDIDKAIDSGQLVIVNNLSELPNNFNFAPTANGAYDPRSNKVYIVASKVMPGQGRKVLLHELGEHYGLERMLGDSYGATLGRLNSLKNTDPKVKAVWDQVGRQYPDIEVGGKLYLQEVMAKIGEQSPQNTLFKRVVAAVKNFLRKLGFFNPNTLTTADMQDLVMYSTRLALAKSDKVTNNQIIASSVGLTPVQLSVAERRKLTDEELMQSDKLEEEAETINFDQDYVTVPANTSFYHGTPRLVGDIIKANNNVINSTSPIKSNAGGLTTEGGLVWVSPRKSTAQVYAQMGEDAGNLFEYKSEKPIKLINFRHILTAEEAEIVNKALNIPDYKQVKAGDGLDLAGTYRSAFAKNMDKYRAVNYKDGKIIYRDKNDEPTTDETLAKGYGMGPLKPMYVDRMTAPWPIVLKALGYDGYFHGPRDFVGGIQVALAGDLQTDLMYSKTDIPAGLEQTSVYLSGIKDDSKTFYSNFVDGFEKVKNQPVDSLASLWNQVRIKMAYSGAGIERKLVNEYEGAVTDGLGVRADIIMSQALDDSVMASQSAAEGKVVFGEDRVARVVTDENNINNLVKLRQQLADQTSIELAEGLIQSYTSARRYRLELDRVEQRAANIASRKEAIKTANQELKTAKGDDKKQLNKLIARYQKQNERDKEKNESINITPEQEAAIEPGLAYAQQYPVLVEVGAMIDAINKNRIDLLEDAGVYTKDMADDYRDREGYVPLFREILEDLGKGDQTITQYFSGFADIGREYGFTGSDKDTKHVLGNLLQQHFWAVSASLRNNANYEAAKQVGLHDDQNNLILYNKKPDTGTAAPVMVDGERKFVEYSDPALAIGIQGALPVYKGILKYFGLAAKWFRLGITANPIFQTYQVINDALGAAMYSGVRSPLKLGKEIISGYVRDQYFRDTKAIDAQMARLGIAGGFGRTPGDIFLKAQRQLGVENMNKWQKLVDATDAFASRSDLAQRRGIFVQTLLESGGVRQADGSVVGGNEILAMNRALNIINWQKRGASSSVRTMTHVIPFANAYLQGMDVLLNAMAGKGLSGTDAQTARILFLKTALALTMFNMLYSMVVAGEEEYEELDDRIKFRNYIVPGTGFKLPVRAEISLLTKYIPEQAYQYVTKLGTTNEVDATKLFDGMSLAVRDAAMGPNLFPQLIRGSVEVATNYNFYTGRPLIGLGLSRLDTAEQYNEATSELAKLLGSTGMVAPINADHIIRSYFGTVGSTALFVMDQAANTMIGNEKPAMRLKDFPLISPLLYSAQGRDKLNDFYELKQASDEATATVNRLMKYDPKKALEYRKDNAKMIGTRKQVNRLSNTLKDLRARRKFIIESGMDGDKKRAALTNVEKRMNNVVRSIARLRIASGL